MGKDPWGRVLIKKKETKDFLMTFLFYRKNLSNKLSNFRYCEKCGNTSFYVIICHESGIDSHMCAYCHKVLKIKPGEGLAACQYVDIPPFWANEDFYS
jgi:hypothetical protein